MSRRMAAWPHAHASEEDFFTNVARPPENRRRSRRHGRPRDALGLEDGHRVVVAVIEDAEVAVGHDGECRVASRFGPHHGVILPRGPEVARGPHFELIAEEVKLRVRMAEVELLCAGM
eukprot:2855650-Prymnesium_polylepis.1